MALLSGLMRTAAITGHSDRIDAWFADRQGARWIERTVQAAFPPASRPLGVARAGR
jgi:hypothetical protein